MSRRRRIKLYQTLKVRLGSHDMLLDPDGGLFWPKHELLAVADIHLEKGAAFARLGVPIPPYDTDATLERLEAMLERHLPKTVISMGDAFHDRAGPAGLNKAVAGRLKGLVDQARWIWLAGNHDPTPATGFGGEVHAGFMIDAVRFVHMPGKIDQSYEIAGHMHPKARLQGRALGLSRRCFAFADTRLIMPAFGAYTGGLNVLDNAIAGCFDGPFDVVLLGDRRLFRLPASKLTADPPRWQSLAQPT